MSKGGGWFGNCSAWEGANDLPWKEEIVWETERVQVNYAEKINFIQDSFQKIFQHCKSTSHWLLLEFYILYHIKMHISEYVCKTFLEELAFSQNAGIMLWNIIAACSVSKIAAIQQVFFYHFLRTVPKNFQSLSKFFQSISKSHSEPFK